MDAPESIHWLVGLDAIGKYCGWSRAKVIRMAIKYGFPLMRLPSAKGRQGWQYHVPLHKVHEWVNAGIATNWERLASSSHGKRLQATRGKTYPKVKANGHDPAPATAKGGGVKPAAEVGAGLVGGDSPPVQNGT